MIAPYVLLALIAALFAIAVLVPYFLLSQRANAGCADPAANVDAVAFAASLLEVLGRTR